MRRLPVLTERRAFLLGLVSSVAACATESESTSQRRGASSGVPGRPTPTDGGAPPEGDEDGGEVGPNLPPRDAGKDSADAAPSPGCAIAGIDTGKLPASFAVGTLTYIAAANAYIGRDAGGLYGMYALCTHTVGNLSIGATQLTCLVHGARFSLTGDLLQGPATIGLPHFAICLNGGGNVAVDPKVIVPSATRMAV